MARPTNIMEALAEALRDRKIAQLEAVLRDLTNLIDEEVRRWDDAGHEFPNADEIVPLLERADALLETDTACEWHRKHPDFRSEGRPHMVNDYDPRFGTISRPCECGR